jgi:hypothetical protein
MLWTLLPLRKDPSDSFSTIPKYPIATSDHVLLHPTMYLADWRSTPLPMCLSS